MNKIKLLYNVVNAMREKDVLKGMVKVQVNDENLEIVNLTNEFEKDFLKGQTKAKINTVIDYHGKKVQHQSTTEFELGEHGICCKWGHRPYHHEHCKPQSFKGKLALIATILQVINDAEVVENGEKIQVVADLSPISGNLKKHFSEHPHHNKIHTGHKHQIFGDLATMTEPNIKLEVDINGDRLIEKANIFVEGKKQCADSQVMKITAKAELSLNW